MGFGAQQGIGEPRQMVSLSRRISLSGFLYPRAPAGIFQFGLAPMQLIERVSITLERSPALQIA